MSLMILGIVSFVINDIDIASNKLGYCLYLCIELMTSYVPTQSNVVEVR